jgi:uncharacterized RDD family membrane protein YckC
MLLRCPHCGYSREIETTAAQPGPVRVLCPSCHRQFAIETGDDTFIFEPAPAAPAASVVASPTVPPVIPSLADLPKAGFWVRVVAVLIDSALIFAAQMILNLILVVALGLLIDGFDSESLAMFAVLCLFGFTLGMVYYVFFTAHGGQTPGKMAVRIKVIRTDGTEIGLGKAFYREVVCKFISAIIFYIGYLMVAFDEKKQGLHDRMAETYVVKL